MKKFAARAGIAFVALFLTGKPASAQVQQGDLTQVSIENLMDMEVSSVAKKEQKVSNTAAAIFVITQEDIRRSGLTSVPELLRIVPGLDVAHIDASKWAISARGFNSRYANKLLVLIDGRSLYSHNFAGVYWEVQDLMLEDIERIEVVRGPGATLWGANAVNGIINIITKRAKDTQGGLVTLGGGMQERGFAGVRYGSQAGQKARYRIYAKGFDRGEFDGLGTNPGNDGWHMFRAGFRTDWEISPRDTLTVQGDGYQGDQHQFENFVLLTPPFSQVVPIQTALSGGNLLSRWTRTFSTRSSMSLQFYYDNWSRRDIAIHSTVHTVDFDFQHRFGGGERHDIIWGAGYRRTLDSFQNSFQVGFLPASSTGEIYSVFIQDEIGLIPRRLHFIAGIRLEHVPFTGLQTEPNGRLLWNLSDRQTVWISIAQATRTPDRALRGLAVSLAAFPGPNGTPAVLRLLGSAQSGDEEVLAFESGYRIQPTPRLSFDFAAFYNKYKDISTTDSGIPFFEPDPAPAHIVLPLYFANQMHGQGYGGELSVVWKPIDQWKLSGSYALLCVNLQPNPGSVNPVPEVRSGDNPRHQFQLRSQWDLTKRIEFDQSFYFVGRLPDQSVPAYVRADVRLGWRPSERTEFSLVGQNLLAPRHLEFAEQAAGIATQDTRKVFARFTWRF